MERLQKMRPPTLPSEACEKVANLRSSIERLDRNDTLATLAGLQTAPEWQAHTIRLDWATRLVAAYAKGQVKLKRAGLGTLLNGLLSKADITRLEDPIEDFFVAPIVTRGGEFLTFLSAWEKAVFHTENILEAFEALPEGGPKAEVLMCAHALLVVGQEIVRRAELDRWTVGFGQPAGSMKLPSERRLRLLANRVRLSWNEISALIPDTLLLQPFVMPENDLEQIADQALGNSLLEFKPLFAGKNGILVAAPGNITTAVRGYLINTVVIHGMATTFRRRLLDTQARMVSDCGFVRLDDVPDMRAGDEILRQTVKEVSKGRYVHLVATVDGFENWKDSAFDGFTPHGPEFSEIIFEGARQAREVVKQQPGYKQGMTLTFLGGWGRGRSLEFEVPPDLRDWEFNFMEPSEAAVLAALQDAKLTDIWRFWRQFNLVRGMGFDFDNASGFLNLYQWWRESDNAFVPEHMLEVTPPYHINFGSDRLLEVRREAAIAFDRRSVMHPDGFPRVVIRVEPRSLFERLEPIYASVDAVRQAELLGVVLSGRSPTWVSRNASGPRTSDEYETWRTVMRWVEIGLAPFENAFSVQDNGPVLIDLDVAFPDLPNLADVPSDEELEGSLQIDCDSESRRARLSMSAQWHLGLRRQDNRAEVLLAGSLLAAIAKLRGVSATRDRLLSFVRDVIGSEDHRWRHSFVAERPIEIMRAQGLLEDTYRPIPLSAAALVKCASALCVPGSRPGQKIEGQEECFSFLMTMQAELLSTLCEAVKQFCRKDLVLVALDQYQAALAEERGWAMSARALRMIHGVAGDQKASFEQRNQINATIRACSILAEMASSHAPLEEGYTVGVMDFDELRALALLVFMTMDLIPALRGGQLKPELGVSPTGHLLYDHNFGETALGSSVRILHTKDREEQSQAYAKFFQSQEATPAEPDREFIEAVEAEFGVTADVFLGFSRMLANIAAERGRASFSIRRSELIEALGRTGVGGDPDFGQLIDRLTLLSRNGWSDLPPGTTALDFDISRFDRRYSLIGRPIVALTKDDDPLLAVAPSIVERSARHNIGGASVGGLQAEFWTSSAMRRYVGKAGERAGLAFNERVAEAVRAQGLLATASVKPSACLNHKATDALKLLGDIDVLAFTADGRHAWVIEAKDIKLCRTLAETARRLSEYRGLPLRSGKPDNLLRHLNRVAYIRRHAADLAKRNKLPDVPKVHGLVIVDVPQPMTFVAVCGSRDARFIMVDALSDLDWKGVTN